MFPDTDVILDPTPSQPASAFWQHLIWVLSRWTDGQSYALLAAIVIAVLFAIHRLTQGDWVKLRTPTLWIFGGLFLFISSGVTGIQLSQSSFDRTYHDTYYIVSYFLYSLTRCAIFVVFAAIYHWLPKLVRRAYPEWAGRLQVLLMFIGVNLMFFPQYALGRQGMPRRYIDYAESFALWNTIASFGALLSFLSLVVFIAICIYTLFWGKRFS